MKKRFCGPWAKTIDDYIGHTDADIYGEEIAEIFRLADQEVFSSGRTWSGFEVDGKGNQIYVIKYIRYSHGIKVGIGGIVIPHEFLAVPGMLDFLKAA